MVFSCRRPRFHHVVSTREQRRLNSEAKITRFNEIVGPRQEIQRLNALNTQMMQTEDKQISLTDPNARSMATRSRQWAV
jgi:hypothetical protein